MEPSIEFAQIIGDPPDERPRLRIIEPLLVIIDEPETSTDNSIQIDHLGTAERIFNRIKLLNQLDIPKVILGKTAKKQRKIKR